MSTELRRNGLPDAADELLDGFLRAIEPTATDPFRKRRIFVQLTRVRSRRTMVLRALVTAGVVLGTASAMAALVSSYSFDRVLPAVAKEAVDSVPKLGLDRQVSPSLPAVSSQDPNRESNRTDNEGMAVSPRVTMPPVSPNARETKTVLTPGEDPALIRSAIDALRRRRDPADARRTLERYLRQHPNGIFAEEARALSIEAAVAMGDPRAKEIAEAYLRSYPRGRHADLANRVRGERPSTKPGAL